MQHINFACKIQYMYFSKTLISVLTIRLENKNLNHTIICFLSELDSPWPWAKIDLGLWVEMMLKSLRMPQNSLDELPSLPSSILPLYTCFSLLLLADSFSIKNPIKK